MDAIVVPHDPAWADAFHAEAAAISSRLGAGTIRLHHIGSTAIAGILAKPTIDLLGEVPDLAGLDLVSPALEGLNYRAMGPHGIEGRRFFLKDDAAGRRTHHLHVFVQGSAHAVRHLAFRDYLIAHPETAAAYSALKRQIVALPGTTRDTYLVAKGPFIARTEAEALAWYQGREGP
ncbi:MAG: GrpB family protein [Limimaricola sp.]|nr:GrpB family protein [Limimaricola sp.]